MDRSDRRELLVWFVLFIGLSIILICGRTWSIDDIYSNIKNHNVVNEAYADEIQLNDSLEIASEDDLKKEKKSIPIYQMFFLKYIDIDVNEEIADSEINVANIFFDSVDNLIKNIEGYNFFDIAIDGEFITYRYSLIHALSPGVGLIDGRSIEEKILADTLPLGDSGRLYIPKCRHSIKINYGNGRESGHEYNQLQVDLADTGLYFPWGVEMLIGDHNTQGFDCINWLDIGDCVYIKKVDGTIDRYKCIGGAYGINNVEYYIDGHTIYDMNPGGLGLVTCRDDSGINVVFRFFQPG